VYRGSVYVARFGNQIKIGYSTFVDSRIRQLSSKTGIRGEVLCTFDVTDPLHVHSQERALHDRFRHLRIKGEWYRAEPDLLEWAERRVEGGKR
jgi:hypothetical protein